MANRDHALNDMKHFEILTHSFRHFEFNKMRRKKKIAQIGIDNIQPKFSRLPIWPRLQRFYQNITTFHNRFHASPHFH